MTATEKWLIGLVAALVAGYYVRQELEIHKLRTVLHKLMNDLPKIILDWISFDKRRDKDE